MKYFSLFFEIASFLENLFAQVYYSIKRKFLVDNYVLRKYNQVVNGVWKFMHLIKMEKSYYIIYLIASIFIPPLFIINLIILIVKSIHNAKIEREEKIEIEEYNEFVNSQDLDESNYNVDTTNTFKYQNQMIANQTIIIKDEDKDRLLPLLNIISNSYLGNNGIIIRRFIVILMCEKVFLKSLLEDFIDFLISLDEITPAHLKLEEIQQSIEIIQEILYE